MAPAFKFATIFKRLDVLPKPDAKASFFILIDEDHSRLLEIAPMARKPGAKEILAKHEQKNPAIKK